MENTPAFLQEMQDLYDSGVADRGLMPVCIDPLVSTTVPWIGKNSVNDSDKNKAWAAITFMMAKVEARCFERLWKPILHASLKYGARQHWGKKPWQTRRQMETAFGLDRIQRFRDLRTKLDPQATFLNDPLSKYFL